MPPPSLIPTSLTGSSNISRRRTSPSTKGGFFSLGRPAYKRRRTFVTDFPGKARKMDSPPRNRSSEVTMLPPAQKSKRAASKSRIPRSQTVQTVLRNPKITKFKAARAQKGVNASIDSTRDSKCQKSAFASKDARSNSAQIGSPELSPTHDRKALVSPVTSQSELRAQQIYGYIAYDPRNLPRAPARPPFRPDSSLAVDDDVRSELMLDVNPFCSRVNLPEGPTDQLTASQSPGDLCHDRSAPCDSDIADRKIYKDECSNDASDLSDADLIAAAVLASPSTRSNNITHSHTDTQKTVAMTLERAGVDADDDLDEFAFDNDLEDATLEDIEAYPMMLSTPAGTADETMNVQSTADSLESSASHHIRESNANDIMKPIVRPALPALASDRSSIVGLSTSTLLRTCFRIGEAINEARKASRARQDVIIELYARLHSASKAGQDMYEFKLGDIWHARPPYLEATCQVMKGKDLWSFDADSLCCESTKPERMCRCIGRIMTEHGKIKFSILSIWEANWDDVEHVKGIVCEA